MRTMTESEYAAIHPDYKGCWTRTTAEIQGDPTLAGLRNMLVNGGADGTVLETEGRNFVIVPDPPTLERLRMYKTAWSPLHERFVGIVKVRADEDGEPIIHARVQGEPEGSEHLFRTCELERFCL